MKNKKAFSTTLLKWFDNNDRPLPWKGEKNPYYIWLSEIILQQTRVAQGLPYFEKFKKHFPTVKDLADASEDTVMKLWEGLGYYSRARNLHTTAKFIAYQLEGHFPTTHEEILKLKGVGPYTAAAIASFAYNLPHAVVDGNVYRVLSRVFGIETPIDTTIGKKEFAKLAQELLDEQVAGKYNQAIMDFGATQCVPANPDCTICPFQKKCLAFQKEKITLLPIKSKKIKKRERAFNYLIFKMGEEMLLQKRLGKDIWQNLYQFPLIEADKILSKKALLKHPDFLTISNHQAYEITKISKPFQQQLTHQKIIAVFWEISINLDSLVIPSSFLRINQKNIPNFAFPKIIDWYLKDKTLYLELY